MVAVVREKVVCRSSETRANLQEEGAELGLSLGSLTQLYHFARSHRHRLAGRSGADATTIEVLSPSTHRASPLHDHTRVRDEVNLFADECLRRWEVNSRSEPLVKCAATVGSELTQ